MRERYLGRNFSVVRVKTDSRLSMGRWIAWAQTLEEARLVAKNTKPVEGYEVWIEDLRRTGIPKRIEMFL